MNVRVTFTPQDQKTRDSLQRYITAKILHISEIQCVNPVMLHYGGMPQFSGRRNKNTVNTNYKIKEEPYQRATTAVKRNTHH